MILCLLLCEWKVDDIYTRENKMLGGMHSIGIYEASICRRILINQEVD